MKTMFKRIALSALLLCASVAALAQTNTTGTIIPSATYTASFNTTDFDNAYYHGASFVINISALTSGTFTFTVQGKDPVSGAYYTILASTALNSTGTTVLKVFPGITATGNAAANDILPRIWRVSVTGASTPSATFSVGLMYQL